MLTNENILLHYALQRTFNNDPLLEIGATDSLTLRTVDTISGDTANVRKFGIDYLITQVTDIQDPINVNMKFLVYALDGTLLGSRVGGAAFVAGSTVTAQGCYLEIEASGGAVTVLSSITIDTDIDAGGLTFTCVLDIVLDGDTLRLYLSDTGSTYYDSGLIYGGDRHSPALNNSRKPYFTIAAGYSALNSANDGVLVLDSAVYDEELDLDRATTFVLAAIGQTPTITRGKGTRITRSTTQEYNNLTAYYFNTNGNDANPGTWQEPVLTLAQVDTLQGAGAFHAVYGGSGAESSATYDEDINFDSATGIKFESDYFYMLTINSDFTNRIDLYGINFDGLGTNVVMITLNKNRGNNIIDCTIQNTITNASIFFNGSDAVTNTVNNCFFLNNDICITLNNVQDGDINIDKNIFENYIYGIREQELIAAVGAPEININNNVFNSNNQNHIADIQILERLNAGTHTYTGNWNNNIFINGIGRAIWFNTNVVTDIITAINMNNNIIMDKAKGIDNDNTNFTPTARNNCFFNNTLDTEGLIINTAPINDDPDICNETNGHFGIQPISPCYRAGNDSDDVGIKTRIIEINGSNITINGFIIDGQIDYATGIFILDTANHTDIILKWNTIKRFIGGGVDLYDDDTDLDAQILNCKINNNGYGAGLHYGGNTVQENLFYRNSQQGLYLDQTVVTVNHNVFFLNNYGLYLDTNIAAIFIKNNIINSNSTNGIFSNQTINTITNCDITDFVSSNVDIADETNITASPLFINVSADQENFNIKTRKTNVFDSEGNIVGQFSVDSPCLEKADDGTDIGAYQVNREKAKDWYSKFQLYSNPMELNPLFGLRNSTDFINALGSTFKIGSSHKWTFPFNWSDNDDQTEEQVDIIRYIASLVETDENGLFGDATNVLIHFLPDQLILTGTDGIIDINNNTLSDSNLNMNVNKYKGFHIGVKFFSGSTLIIDSMAKTMEATGESFDTDEWKGFFIYNRKNYYLVLSNDADTFVVSDPFDTLIDETLASFSVEKYFKIFSNSKNQFKVIDEDGELLTGTFPYYIDFIICQSESENFQTIQEGYFFKRKQSQTGMSLPLGEK